MIAATTVRITNNGAGGFFRSMNREFPHARDEHEGYNLTLFDGLIPGAAKPEVNEVGHVDNVHVTVKVHVGNRENEALNVFAQHMVDQVGHIDNIHAAVTIDVAPVRPFGEVARVAGAAVDVGISLVNVVGIIGRALATHKAVASIEHIK